MDTGIAWTIIGVGVGSVGFIYQALSNFKADIDRRMDRFESRMDSFDDKIISLEERMFHLATGKTLAEAIILEKMKKSDEKNP
jgi:hypothetical protein